MSKTGAGKQGHYSTAHANPKVAKLMAQEAKLDKASGDNPSKKSAKEVQMENKLSKLTGKPASDF